MRHAGAKSPRHEHSFVCREENQKTAWEKLEKNKTKFYTKYTKNI